MNDTDFIVIGAGAAGLMCAKELLSAGKSVMILEARDRIGGRIYTVIDNHFPLPVELSAEFIHGDLPLTKQLLDEAGIGYYKIEGEIWRSQLGMFTEEDDFIENPGEIIDRLKKLPADMTISDFLDRYFSGEKYSKLRKTLTGFVEGYDAADSKRASAFALLQELLGEDDNQYRIKGGYGRLVNYLYNECMKEGGNFKMESVVKEIRWNKNHVEAIDQTGNHFTAKKIVVTVPLGVLQSPPQSPGHIDFSPAIYEVQKAIDSLGFGTVIKTIFQFDEPIWNYAENIDPNKKKTGPGFLFSDAIIPTWWTQLPEKNSMITGWLAGPKATRLQNEPDDKLIHLALESLAVIFHIPRAILQSKLRGVHILNWFKDEFARGAYAYETVESKKAKGIISDAVEDIIYFAGEACYEGSARGTVEAALVNGRDTAGNILKIMKQ